MAVEEEAFASGIFIGLLVAFAITIILVLPQRDEWERGWCEGKGGTLITESVCNIDGKVVEVPNG